MTRKSITNRRPLTMYKCGSCGFKSPFHKHFDLIGTEMVCASDFPFSTRCRGEALAKSAKK